MFAAGTDGASVGKHAGVTTKLKTNINPYMISVHCIAHRLALASAQAAHKVKRIDKFEIRMNQIFNYFDYSTKHMSKIKQIYQVGGNAMHRNFVRPCDTRWLSVRGAFEAVLINLKAMFYCMQSDAESGDSTAKGMLNEMATFDFLATLHLMADILYYLGQLSCVFQKTYLDLSSVDGHIKAVVNVLKNMKDDPGRRLKSFLSSVPETPSELYMKVAAANLTDDISLLQVNLQVMKP
ncbi:zinc finger protein 862-like [Saccoglossus kowalevskii]